MAAKLIELDASGWRDVLDFYDAILARLGAPREHGRSVNALVDSMVWGGMNKVAPPYVIKLRNTEHLPSDLVTEIALARQAIAAARAEARDRTGRDVDIEIEMA